MPIYLNNNDINMYYNKINNEYIEINILKNKIKFHDDNIKNIKKILLNNCNHVKEINHDSYNEHTEYYCSKCKLDL